jgi:hypothetical protein
MPTNLVFNVSTKKYQGVASPSATIYAKVYDPNGNLILDKSTSGNAFITASTTSGLYNLPLDTSSNVLQGTYRFEYSTVAGMGSGVTTALYTYLGATQKTACFNVEHNCDYYPTGLITATDSTYYGDNSGTATNPQILSRTIYLYYPDGLVDPSPTVNPAEGVQSPITTGNYSLTVDTLATGMWTAIMDVQLSYTQDDDLVIKYQLKKTLNHNVSCVGQLCSINSSIDQITQAYNSDVACGASTPRYANELTLINAYYSQYQMERACGNTEKANEYLTKMNELVGEAHSCGCSSGSCSGSCGSSCSCNSCGDDNTPRWINTPGSTTLSILEQIQEEIDTLQNEIDNLPAGPQGPQGVQGPAGVPGPVGPAGLTWRGTWVSGTSYVLNDAVGYNGASYFCILATSGTTAPDLATSNWALLASQGAIGPQGVQGPTGPQGPAGSAAAATQGAVTGGPDYNLAGIFSYDFNTVNPVTGSTRYLLPSNPTIGKVVTVLNYSATVAATIKSFTQGADFIGNYNNSYTSTTGVKAGETIRFIYVGNGYWKIEYVASQNIFFNNFQLSSALFGTGQNGIDYRIVETTVNTTTTALSAATLNTNYPDGANPNGLKIYCPNISGGGLVYIKTGTSTWVSIPITNVV